MKSHGTKIRVRTDTQTEKDLLRVTQEELVYDALDELLSPTTTGMPSPVTIIDDSDDEIPKGNFTVSTIVATKLLPCEDRGRDLLVDQEVLVSWLELVNMCVHCFPSVGEHVSNGETVWEIGQHCVDDINGERYHYWGTDTRYVYTSRNGSRRRRDMVRVGLQGEHLADFIREVFSFR